MFSSGVLVQDVLIYGQCDCNPDDRNVDHTCTWAGPVDATIDPEDSTDAVWVCPACGCEHATEDGAW